MGGPGLVIFDCNGVLVDSERLAVAVEAAMLADLGWSLSEAEVIERFVGRSVADAHAQVEAHLGRPVPSYAEDYRTRTEAAFRTHLTAVDGIGEALDALDAAGVATCVASSGTHERMRLTLGITGLHERFDGRITSATEVAHGKPAPDLFLLAAERAGVDPRHCVVVEDSRPGVLAARAAGMASLGYVGGVTAASALEGAGTVLFSDMREVPSLVARAGLDTGDGR